VQQVTTSATPVPPAAPSNLIVRTTNDRDFLLNWTDNSNNETGFVITRRVNNTGDFVRSGRPGRTSPRSPTRSSPRPRATRRSPTASRRATGRARRRPRGNRVVRVPGRDGPDGDGVRDGRLHRQPTNPNDPKVYLDPEIGENWSLGPPVAGIPEDGFSIVWSGQLLAEKTEPYTFQIQGDDNFELIITDATTGAELVNLPLGPSATARNSTPVPLVANTRYNIGSATRNPPVA
jgi:hypothetical protein